MMRDKNTFAVSLTLLVLCLWGGVAQGGGVEDTAGQNIITPIKSRAVGSRVAVGGTVTPVKSVTLAAQLPGRVQKIAGEEGDSFKKGRLLVRLDAEELRAQRQSAIAAWRSAYAAWSNAHMQYTRELASPGSSRQTPGGMAMPGVMDEIFTNPMSDMLGTRDPGYERYSTIHSRGTQIEQARQSIIQAQSQVRAIDTKLRDAKSIAPFSGVIVKKFVEEGDTVQPGQPLLEYANTTDLEIIADIPARLSQELKVKQVVPARIDTLEQLIDVSVSNIFPMADTLRHTIRVKFALPPDIRVAAGVYAEVQLQDPLSADTPSPVIPRSAIIFRGGLPMVYLLDENKRTKLRMIRIGETLPNGEVVILAGLHESDKMVLDNPSLDMKSDHQLP